MNPNSQVRRAQNIYMQQESCAQGSQISGRNRLPDGGEVQEQEQEQISNLPFPAPVPTGAAMAAGLRSQLSLTSKSDLINVLRMTNGPEFNRILNTFGVDINRLSADGLTPLMMTVRQNNLPKMQVLLECPELEVNLRNRQGNTALHMAAQAGQVDLLEALLNDVRIDCNVHNMRDISALCLAARHNHYQVVERLLDHQMLTGKMPEDATNEYLKAYRLAGDRNGFCTALTLLRSNPWLQNAFRSDGHTALTAAIKAGRLDVVEILLKQCQGLNVDLAGEGLGTALNVAASQHDMNMLLTLLRHPGVDPNKPVDNICNTVLHLAAARGEANTVQALMSALPVIDVNAVTKWMHTPLHKAARCGDVDTLRVLATRVEDINQRDENGQSALHFAASAGDIESVEFLLQLSEIKPMVCSNTGEYPSDIAEKFGHADVARILHDAELQEYTRQLQHLT
jgi:ankyrin repeat protein